LEANLSVSIIDGAIPGDSSDHIVSRFLLTSDLRGSIYNPSYYFKNKSDSITQQLDLVMLTNGWRRFKWEDVSKGKPRLISYLKDTTYLSLSGTITNANPSDLQNGGSLMMMIRGKKDTITKTLFAYIQNNGSFKSSDYIFFDSLKVYYQLPGMFKKAKVDFMTARLSALKYDVKDFVNIPFRIDTVGLVQFKTKMQEVEALKGKDVLQEVRVTARRVSRLDSLDKKYAKGLFAGGDAKQFDLLHDPIAYTYPNVLHYLQGKVAGLHIKTDSRDPDYFELIWRGGTPTIYINEVPVEHTEIAWLSVSSIAYIKVLPPPFMGTRGGVGDPAHGAIAIYTKRGGDGFEQIEEPKLPSSTIIGYSPIREFSSPDYAAAVSASEEKDLRTTLLWRPNVVKTKEGNKITVSFYNSDLLSKSFRMVIEGMSKDGRLTHLEKVIEK
jgi:hypothetical protein